MNFTNELKMTYSQLYFGKELNELTYEDIEHFFVDAKDESNKIEFKSYHNPDEKNHIEKENGVIRAISGLLNSEGGLVIWGAPVGQKVADKKEKIFQGALSPSDKLVEKDSFISRVADLITPSPKGVKFQSLHKAGQYIYIIEVDQSFYAPHQYRNIYNMRIDGQTKPAPHYFVEALFRKISFPKLEGYLKIDSLQHEEQRYVLRLTTMIFNKSKLQNEYEIYYRVLVTVGKFAHYGEYHGNDRIYTLEGHELRVPNAKSTLYYNEALSNTEVIIFNLNDLIKSEFKCDVMFYFGGKQSPLMVSRYKLLLKELNPENLNTLLTSIEENQYTYEKSDKLEITEKEKMKLILGR